MKKNRAYLKTTLLSLAIGVPSAICFLAKNIGSGVLDNTSSLYPFWYIFQSGPFILLAVLCSLRKSDGTFKYKSGCLIGSAIGTLITIGLYLVLNYSNPGESTANIGTGMLFLAMPIFITLSMLFGWFIGGFIGSN